MEALTQIEPQARVSPSDDEVEVMRFIAAGLKDRAIARRLGVSIVTVRRRASRFRERVGARNRSEAVAIAAAHGWISVVSQWPGERESSGE